MTPIIYDVSSGHNFFNQRCILLYLFHCKWLIAQAYLKPTYKYRMYANVPNGASINFSECNLKSTSHEGSAYRADRPTINQAEASVFPSFFSQLKDWLFFCLNFPSLGLFSHQPKKGRFPWKKVKSPSLGLRKITAFQSEHFGLENFTSVFQK